MPKRSRSCSPTIHWYQDPLVWTALFPPLVPLGCIIALDGMASVATWLCIVTMLLSVFYHISQETCVNTLEPLSVHLLFLYLLYYFRQQMQWSLWSIGCLLAMGVCYYRASGRQARECKPREERYICYHSWFHIFGSLFFTITLWSSACVAIRSWN